MLKYLEFINESLELVLESDVVFSDKFRKVISKIDHPFSKMILDSENKDYPVQSNYFDIQMDKNDMVSFIPDRKAQEILGDARELVRYNGNGGWLKHSDSNKKIFDIIGYIPINDEPYKPNSTETGEVIKKVVSEESGNTYALVKFDNGETVINTNKLTTIDDRYNKVWSNNRQEVKVGRAMRSLLKAAGHDKFLTRDIEEFVNLYKASIDKLNDKFSYFDVVKGDDISYWYYYPQYLQRSGTLGNSCMSDVPSHYLDIYTKNPNNISLVILKSPDFPEKIVGRAILWKLNDGKMFMDRIYTINDSDVQLFRDYAKDNKWYSKCRNNSCDSSDSFSPDGDTVNLDLSVNLENYNLSKFPYLDTLKYFYPKTGEISNIEGNGCYILEDTGGDWSNMECETCGGNGRISCDECGGDGYFECSECDGGGEIECDECDGNGEIECGECDGRGEIECGECDGSGEITTDDGEIECYDCNGRGVITCGNCDGSCTITCGNCDGRGRVDCDACDGRGRVDCEYCYGDGEIDCPDCT